MTGFFRKKNNEEFTNHGHEMTLEERQNLVIKDFVEDEKSFAEGTVSRSYLDFFKWLQEHTDIFDPVMVSIMLMGREGDRDALRFDDKSIKEIVNTYLSES
jgi:hypothetical protein